METGGVRLFPFLPGFGSFWDPPASASAACCRSGQRSLPTPSHPHDHEPPGFSWLSGAPRRPAPVRLLRARSMIRYAHSPGVPFTVEFSTGLCRTSSPGGSILHVARQQTGPLCATGSKKNPKPGKNGNSGRPLFPKRRLPVFSLLFAFGEII